MTIAITLRGFNDLRRSVTPIIYSMDHFLYRFSTFCEKIKKKIYRVEALIFWKTFHRIDDREKQRVLFFFSRP